MSSQSSAISHNDVEDPVETTPLRLSRPATQSSIQSVASVASDTDNGSEASEDTQVLLEEMNEPWPATFERSIVLLASPVMTARQVDLVTKSPKPGNTPLFGQSAVSVSIMQLWLSL